MDCPDCNKIMEEKPRKYICWNHDTVKVIPKGKLTVGDWMKDLSVVDPRTD